MLERLNEIDTQITLFINSLSTPFTDQIWMTITNKWLWFPMYAIVIGVAFWRLGWKKGLLAVVTFALTILCVDQFANFIKDVVVCRLRPCNNPDVVARGLHILEGVSEKYCYGFFSGHASNSFAFAVSSTMIFKMDTRLPKSIQRGYAAFIYTWAALASVSRIFVGKHYFGDVLVGAIAGAAIGYGITRLTIFLYDRYVGHDGDAVSEQPEVPGQN